MADEVRPEAQEAKDKLKEHLLSILEVRIAETESTLESRLEERLCEVQDHLECKAGVVFQKFDRDQAEIMNTLQHVEMDVGQTRAELQEMLGSGLKPELESMRSWLQELPSLKRGFEAVQSAVDELMLRFQEGLDSQSQLAKNTPARGALEKRHSSGCGLHDGLGAEEVYDLTVAVTKIGDEMRLLREERLQEEIKVHELSMHVMKVGEEMLSRCEEMQGIISSREAKLQELEEKIVAYDRRAGVAESGVVALRQDLEVVRSDWRGAKGPLCALIPVMQALCSSVQKGQSAERSMDLKTAMGELLQFQDSDGVGASGRVDLIHANASPGVPARLRPRLSSPAPALSGCATPGAQSTLNALASLSVQSRSGRTQAGGNSVSRGSCSPIGRQPPGRGLLRS